MTTGMKNPIDKIHCLVRVFAAMLVVVITPTIAIAQQSSSENSETDPDKPKDDVIYLESTLVGDKEQPSVSYFIPWKGTDAPDNLLWQLERKNDDTLNLVDRDIMLRSINIYNEMELETTDN